MKKRNFLIAALIIVGMLMIVSCTESSAAKKISDNKPGPWQQIGQLNDNDIKAIYTFLKTTKPIRNIVPAPKTLEELD